MALVCTLAVSGCNCEGITTEIDAGTLPDVPNLPDVPIECERDNDCDDGLFCNGTETCELGRCETTPTECDDGIDCTTDSCSEDARTCVHDVPDLDSDGYMDARCIDDRGMPLGNDCDDTDAARFPGNLEICDDEGHDEDCSLDTRGGVDADADGFEDIRCCNPMMAGSSAPNCGSDCDDGRRTTNPDGVEICNALNDDCDAATDEGQLLTVYLDADRDGYGLASGAIEACATTAGYSATPGDCDDTRIDRNPGQPEFCDMVDNDCNGTVDDMTREVPWYRDVDGDGFGADGPSTRNSCEPLTSMGYSLLDSDCNDTTRAVSPAATETCNGIDDDCVAGPSFQIAPGDFEDDDADGVVDLACGAPFGEDCDDRNPATGPGSTEICDGRDNDCDVSVDEGATSAVFYRDADLDGYGSSTGGTIVGCMGMAGFVAMGGDCDDTDAARRPGVMEVCNGEDDDCDGAADDSVSLAPLPHAQVGCVAGMTAIVRCDPNYENCNGTTPDGCEADLAGDEMNCRFCGNLCASSGGESRECVAGDCRITSCPSGRSDCNGSAVDGCERTIGTATDCSDCNDRCTLAHVTRQACASGSCTFNPTTDCEAGWGNCDGDLSTGCETPLRTGMNCMACGDSCDATEFCDVSMGTCRTSTSTCTAPTADCDANGSCETNTSTSVTSCGSCGRACTGGNAAWSCVAGGCTITACTGGFHDCDGIASNGCEASPTDVTACGATCQVCATANGVPACTAGSCGIASCSGGWGNCNAIPSDGCETNTTADAANCGFCGNVCNDLPNVTTGTCLAGTCDPVVCDGGFADCSPGVPGCETATASDANNCGACGRRCGVGGECASGACDEILQIANGQYHTCALRSSGTVVCWGENGSGQLGIGSVIDQLTPVVVPGLADVVDIVAGWEHTCALLSSGLVQCWGGNSQDQLGDTSGTNQVSPVAVLSESTGMPLDRVTNLEAGRYTTCALRTTGYLSCWGSNASEIIEYDGPGSYDSAHQVEIVPGGSGKGGKDGERISGFVLGATYIAVIARGWGSVFATGDPPGDFSPNWTGYGELWGDVEDIVEIDSGDDHVCIRRVSGIVECAGDNTNGQLGDGSTITPMGSTVSTLFTSATAIMTFDDTTCVRNTLGQVYCMGANNEAQCTGAGGAPVLSPRRVNVASGGAAFSARVLANGGGGAYRTPCLVSTAGAVFCWGNNIGGSVGDGTVTGREYPTRTVNLTP